MVSSHSRIGTYNDPTKKRGPPKGYIEAIEARLHKMEGLLGGLVKNKDPRADIVRAELDAMAREAEMTGLKLRRSKAYEEMNKTVTQGVSEIADDKKIAVSFDPTEPPSAASSMAGHSSSYADPNYRSQAQPHQHQHQQHHPSHRHQKHQHPQHPYKASAPNVHSLTHPIHSATLTQRTEGYQQHHPHGDSHPFIKQEHNDYSSPAHYRDYEYQQAAQHSGHGHGNGHSSHTFSSPLSGHHSPPNHYQGQSTYQTTPTFSRQDMRPDNHSPHHDIQQSSGSTSYYNGDERPYSPTQYRPPSHHQQPYQHQQQQQQHQHHHHHEQHSQKHQHHKQHQLQSPSNIVWTPSQQSHPDHYGRYTQTPQGSNNNNNNNSSNSNNGTTMVKQETNLEMPSIAIMDHLLAVHFRHVHPVLPMLHYNSISEQIHRNEFPASHLLFAILGLASRFSDNDMFRLPQPGYDRPPCTLFYEQAKHYFKEEYDNSQMATVQALLLMSVQQMGFCESQRAWLYVGMAIRMAQDLGLNKELPEHDRARNRLGSELRKRTWWSCYVVERLVCAGLGRPLTITPKDCQTSYPQHVDDDNIDAGVGTDLVGKCTVTSYFAHLITLSRIQGNILEFIKARAVHDHFNNDTVVATGSNNSNNNNHNASTTTTPPSSSTSHHDQDHQPTIDISQTAFFALDKSLAAWRQDLPEALQAPTKDSPHFGLFLHMTYNNLLILLHRPETAYLATSASLCTEAAATITEITEILMDAKALTSMFISCLYSIFSAGVVHFMNIPSPKRSCESNISSPRMKKLNNHHQHHHHHHGRCTNEGHSHYYHQQQQQQQQQHPSASSAKANMKRCIDALKFLASHWVSAARRAKVLEDLLDLKHVSLDQDLEERGGGGNTGNGTRGTGETDSFKTTAMEPSWAKSSTGYSKILESPREGHDQLRQQCRSKMMAIHSLLVNDDDEDANEDDKDESVLKSYGSKKKVNGKNDMDIITDEEEDASTIPGTSAMDVEGVVDSSSPSITARTNGSSSNTVQSSVVSVIPSTTTTSIVVNNNSTTSTFSTTNTNTISQLDTDPMMLMSTARLALNDTSTPSPPPSRVGKMVILANHHLSSGNNDMSDDPTMMSETLGMTLSRSTTPATAPSRHHPHSQTSSSSSSSSSGGAIFDPFSMPSSITFPHLSHNSGRRMSGGSGVGGVGVGGVVSNGSSSGRDTYAQTYHTTAWSGAEATTTTTTGDWSSRSSSPHIRSRTMSATATTTITTTTACHHQPTMTRDSYSPDMTTATTPLSPVESGHVATMSGQQQLESGAGLNEHLHPLSMTSDEVHDYDLQNQHHHQCEQNDRTAAAGAGTMAAGEERDLVWHDMPPTLGLDEWMAYIGAMMMRWLASGESSPRSVSS
ncbi:hypothetical protein BG004_003841 [Podila humilis]|nr:hypothetical protein BG004_003841 [Podila humilis]